MPSLKTSHRWVVAQNDPAKEQLLVQGLGVAPLVARIMVSRGIDSVEEGKLFLTPSLERDWEDPRIIPGMCEVADRVERAVRSGETIAVFGDFDVDGITSTCLLTEGLRALGATVHPFIPRRFDEGYGLSEEALERVVEACSPDLVVTVDNGIAARDEVAALISLGIDIVVTDHHEPADLVPQEIAVADPKLVADGPSRELAGAGVALKLVQELGRRLGVPDLWRRYTEVAALGTVSDMMRLTRENRALVADGIAQMRATSRPGYIALAALARIDLSAITADALSFSLIPRLNSAGRMADPALALDLLLAQDPIEAGRLASELERINQQRRDIEAALAEEALAEVERTYDGARAIVVGGEGWHEGVKGIVASRITNRYHVPALLFSIQDGIARGSGRSVGSVNLFDAVEQCSDILLRFGGHAGAVGVTLEADKLDELRRRLSAVLAEVPAQDFEDTDEVSATVSLGELDIQTIEQIAALEPFGQGNRVPLLAATGVTMCDRAVVGKTGDHMKFVATDGVACVPAIMFRVPDIKQRVCCDAVVDLVFEAVAERWQGRVKPKLMVKDILCHEAQDATQDGHDGFEVSGGEGDLAADSAAPRDVRIAVAGAVVGDDDEPCKEGDSCVCEPVPQPAYGRREMLSQLSYEELTRSLIHSFIGPSHPYPAQLEALRALAAGSNTMVIMGTGRGKSLIFQVHAAREAIVRRRASVFVYPLRALVADQAFHLTDRLASCGLRARVLTGETSFAERNASFAQIAAGDVDVVLTTPEFLAIHRDRFAATGRIGFLAIDEAHHAGLAKGGERSAYLEMPQVLQALKSPCVLAATATAGEREAAEIARLLSIRSTVVDDAIRENLLIDDGRDLSARENRLVSIVATGEKCVVYVNSRDASMALARTLRRRVPEYAGAIGFYHAGLTRGQRTRIEEAFRSGELRCIVATSAFGEGVNLPDIRHVVLYHMPFGDIEFNQMSGRAGRDGEAARIHLLYSTRDARINERLLNTAAPAREELVTLYRALQTMWRARAHQDTPEGIMATDADIVQMCLAVDARTPLDKRAVACGLSVFEELGFARVSACRDGFKIVMVDHPGRVDLTQSIRYLEGLRARLEFSAFKSWALTAPASDMLSRVNRPITPRVC